MTVLPRVVVVGTGGTMAWSSGGRLGHGSYGRGGGPLPLDELLALVPEVLDVADVVPVDLFRIGSHALGSSDLLRLMAAIDEAVEHGADGVVVTHGTATLEETAYFLELTRRADVPIVVVGAQRPPSLLGSDALLNLHDAVLAAAAPALRDGGTFVCLNRELHDPRDVVKLHTTALDAFRSPAGPLGRVLPDGTVRLDQRPGTRGEALRPPVGTTNLPRVDVAWSYLGADGTAIEAFVAAGAAGIVSAGLLPGLTTPAEHDALLDAVARGVVVVQALRAGSGRVVLQGDRAGVITAGDLSASKARILTAVGLAAGLSRDALADRFEASPRRLGGAPTDGPFRTKLEEQR